MKDTILKALKKYGIKTKQLYTITSDNGANMIKAIQLVEEESVGESEMNLDLESNQECLEDTMNSSLDSNSDSEVDR